MKSSRFGLTDLFSVRLFTFAAVMLLAIMALAVAACGDDDDDDDNGDPTAAPATSAPADGTDPPANGGGEIDYGSLSGQIIVDGSSTVEPISSAMAEEFNAVAPSVRVNVGISGTGGGFERFCNNETQISDASRPIEEDEVEVCAGNGIDDIVEIQVAIDALTVMVHPDNDFVDCLTVEQVHEIFRTGGATNWNEVDPSFPDQSITWYYPDVDSGTFDYFVEAIIEGVDEDATHTGSGTNSADDNVLALGIQGDTNAIGYFGFAYFLGAGESLKAVQIDNGEGCVEPSFEAALDGTYEPLSRPLFIYTREEFLAGHPDNPVLGFTKFYLDMTTEIVPDVGYVSLPDDVLNSQYAKIEEFLP